MSHLQLPTNETLTLVTMDDRRASIRFGSAKFLFQSELETLVYRNANSTGAFYRLVSRANATGNAGAPALVLRGKSVADGLVTAQEWSSLVAETPNPKGVRVLTLLPVETAAAALIVAGKDPMTVAILTAIGKLPPDWESEPSSPEQQDSSNGDDGSTSGDGGGAGPSGDGEEEEDGVDEEEDSEEGEEEEEEGEESNEEDEYQSDSVELPKKAKLDSYTLTSIPDSLELDLSAYARFRAQPLNVLREGRACGDTTLAQDRKVALRFLGWLVAEKKLASVDGLIAVFASPKIAGAAKMFAEHLVEERGDKWSTAAQYVLSIISISRFCFEVKKSRGAKASPPILVDDTPMKQLAALHRQSVQQQQLEAKFDRGKHVNFLDWAAVQRARVSAEQSLLALGDGEDRLYALRDVLLMALLTGQPPDRVGVMRKLQLGVTLLRNANGAYQLDLSSPTDHKTAAVFGPSRTTLSATVSTLVDDYVELASLDATQKHYLFYKGDDASNPYESSACVDACDQGIVQASQRRSARSQGAACFVRHVPEVGQPQRCHAAQRGYRPSPQLKDAGF